MFEDKNKADEVAAAVHKQLGEDAEKQPATAHVEVSETKSAA